MGRGRNGITNQSMRRPKVRKYKERGLDFEIRHSPLTKQERPPLLIDHIVNHMKKMSPQDVMNILLPNQSEQDH